MGLQAGGLKAQVDDKATTVVTRCVLVAAVAVVLATVAIAVSLLVITITSGILIVVTEGGVLIASAAGRGLCRRSTVQYSVLVRRVELFGRQHAAQLQQCPHHSGGAVDSRIVQCNVRHGLGHDNGTTTTPEGVAIVHGTRPEQLPRSLDLHSTTSHSVTIHNGCMCMRYYHSLLPLLG